MEINNNKYSELTIAVIGCGAIGKRHIEVLDQMGVGRIIACDPSGDRLKVIKEICPRCEPVRAYSEALKKKPFAVYVLTPTQMHIPQAMEALEAGCHVFIEKPLSNSSEGTDKLAEAEKRTGKKVMVGFCFRFHKAHVCAKKILDSGRIGRLVSVRALAGECFPKVHPGYRNMYYSKYSGAFELVHEIDLAIWYAGRDVERVQGVHGAFSDHDFESPDTVEMLLKFKGKCVASVHLNFFQIPRRVKMELLGTTGSIFVDYTSWDKSEVVVCEENGNDLINVKKETICLDTKRNDMFFAESEAFLDCALMNLPVPITIADATKSLLAIEQIYKPY